jgi:hypothetical protein
MNLRAVELIGSSISCAGWHLRKERQIFSKKLAFRG